MPRPRLTPMRIALALGVTLCFLRFAGCAPLQRLDTRAVDFRLLERGPERASREVVIVAIDDASIAKHGRWPWPRSLLARLLEDISQGEPKVVGFDIVQSESSAVAPAAGLRRRLGDLDERTWKRVEDALGAYGEEDRILGQAIAASGRSVLGYFFDFDEPVADDEPLAVTTYNAVLGATGTGGATSAGERRVPRAVDAVGNLDTFSAGAAGTGYFNLFPDGGDGVFRRMPMAIRYGDAYAMPLSLVMLQHYWDGAQAVLRFGEFGVASVRLGDREIPVAENGQLLLNYRGPRRTFEHVRATDILDGMYDIARVRDRLVLIGVTAAAVADVRSTPFDGVFPGVEIHATAIDNVLRDDFLVQPKWVVLVEMAAVMFSALTLGVALQHARGVFAAAWALALMGTYLGGTQRLFLHSGIPLGMVYPTFSIVLVYSAIAVHHYVVEAAERRKIRNAFGLYLSDDLAQLVSEHPEMLRLGGDKRVLTVLFSDIRGFTSISERFKDDPTKLVEMLNVYLGAMTDIVFEHGGTLDKYVGDAIMAVWGAPVPHDDSAARACRAAVQMVERLETLAAEFEGRGWPRIDIGIGLHTGEMVVGNMGSARRLSYTAIGDNVNTASRLEGLTKHYKTHILASEETVRAAGDTFAVRELDVVCVKGKEDAVRIFEVLGRAEDAPLFAPLVEPFHSGLRAYRERRWREAIACFERLAAAFPADRPSQLYVQRARELAANPPGPEWNAVTVMDAK